LSTGIKGSTVAIESVLDQLEDVESWALSPAAKAVQTHLTGTAKAHTTPEGKPWAPTTKGAPALNNAASEISVRLAGQTIIVELKGNSTWWHYGVRGIEPRQVIPVDIVGEKLGNAIRRGFVAPFIAVTKAGKRGYTATRARGINPYTGRVAA
jgi:hypothetical protein